MKKTIKNNKNINLHGLLKISFFIWVLSVFAFLGETIFFKSTESGIYSGLHSVIFIFTIICGSIAFILFGISLFIFILRKMGVLFIVSVFLLLTSVVFVYFVIKTAPERMPKTEERNVCSRSEMYPMSAEFQRALSLIIQRYAENNDPNINLYSKMLNCVNVQFGDTLKDKAEGFFIFDVNNSSVDKLDIYVDASYTDYDDLTTAFLLSHELTHAKQFVNGKIYGKKLSCVNQEVEAFLQQLIFQSYLNSEEQRSLVTRAEQLNNKNPQLKWFVTLLDLSWEATIQVAGYPSSDKVYSQEEKTQYREILTSKIRQMITSNPYYQQQCGL